MNSCLTKSLVTLGASALVIGTAYYFLSQPKALPVYDPAQINPELVDSSVRELKNHRVDHFSLLDQRGGITDSSFTQGKVHVADFFFTTCQTICPRMTASMETLAAEFSPQEDDVRFLSFSVLPEIDTAPVLKEYAIGYNVDPDEWRLLTGERSDIYHLARTSYFTLKPAEVGEGDGGQSDFIHTNNFVLVDSQQRIRGYYDGTSVTEIKKLIGDVRLLLDEEAREREES